MLGITQQVDIGLRACIEGLAPTMRKAFERACGAFIAKITRHRAPQLVDGDARTEQTETRRDRDVAFTHEDIRLNALHRGDGPPQGEADIGENVERQAPHHAVRELRQIDREQRCRLQRRDPERSGDDHV